MFWFDCVAAAAACSVLTGQQQNREKKTGLGGGFS